MPSTTSRARRTEVPPLPPRAGRPLVGLPPCFPPPPRPPRLRPPARPPAVPPSFRFFCVTRIWPRRCESSVGLSHSGSGTSFALFGPAPAPGRHWLRYLCPPRTIARAARLTLAGWFPQARRVPWHERKPVSCRCSVVARCERIARGKIGACPLTRRDRVMSVRRGMIVPVTSRRARPRSAGRGTGRWPDPVVADCRLDSARPTAATRGRGARGNPWLEFLVHDGEGFSSRHAARSATLAMSARSPCRLWKAGHRECPRSCRPRSSCRPTAGHLEGLPTPPAALEPSRVSKSAHRDG